MKLTTRGNQYFEKIQTEKSKENELLKKQCVHFRSKYEQLMKRKNFEQKVVNLQPKKQLVQATEVKIPEPKKLTLEKIKFSFGPHDQHRVSTVSNEVKPKEQAFKKIDYEYRSQQNSFV